MARQCKKGGGKGGKAQTRGHLCKGREWWFRKGRGQGGKGERERGRDITYGTHTR